MDDGFNEAIKASMLELEAKYGQPEDFAGLNLMAEEVWKTSSSKGFKDRPVTVAEQCANITGEVSELWEAYRTGQLDSPCDKCEKMVEAGIDPLSCLEEELADIVIRALDTAKDHGVDISRAVRLKNEFNKTRPVRNGGKRA